MSEYPVITLVLAIIGTITGVLALFVSFWTYWQERPKLKINVKRLEHKQDNNSLEKIEFTLEFSINNRGNRGTTLNEIEMTFSHDGRNYLVREPIQDGAEDMEGGIKKVNVNACKTIDRVVCFEEYFDGIKVSKHNIDCHFTLYTTHGKLSFDATSEKIIK